MKRIFTGRLAVAGVAVAGLLLAGVGTASASVSSAVARSAASAPASLIGTFTFQNQSSGKCLDVYHSGTADKVNVDQYTCNGTGAQSFRVWYEFSTSSGKGVFELVNTNSGKCLETYHSETTDYANVDQWTCNGTNTQKWVGTNLGLGFYTFANYNSGKCLEVYHSQLNNYANVDQYTCNGTLTQEWMRG